MTEFAHIELIINQYFNLANEIDSLIEKEEYGAVVDKLDDKDSIIKKQELNSAITSFYKSIEDLEATGVSVKSIDQGLMDFPSLMFNEEIWLCWKQGETEIKFWHGKDEGFNGRKPIESVDLEKLR